MFSVYPSFMDFSHFLFPVLFPKATPSSWNRVFLIINPPVPDVREARVHVTGEELLWPGGGGLVFHAL